MKKLGIYARQSRLKETDGSIEDQLNKGKSKADELGKPFQMYVDRGITGGGDSIEDRPAFKEMLEDVKAGKVDAVFAIDCSRLTRNPVTEAIMKEIFREHHVIIHSSIEGVIDCKDSNGDFMSGLLALLNRKQLSDSSSKIRSVLRNRVVAGKAHGSIMKPYGFMSGEDKMLVVNDEEAEIVKRIFYESSIGIGTGKIAKRLNEDNIPTRGRKALKNGIRIKNKYTKEIHTIDQVDLTWKGNTILSMLKNTIYMGKRLYMGEFFPCEKIVEKELWERVQKQLKSNRNKQGEIKHQYLLKGLCVCGRCGRNIVGRTRASKRDHYYYCSSKILQESCGLRSLNIDYLEEIIWYMVANSSQITERAFEEAERLKEPDSVEKSVKELIDLKKKLSKLLPVQSKLVDAFTLGYISDKELKEKIALNKDKIKSLNHSIEFLTSMLEDHDQLEYEIQNLALFQNQLNEIKTTSSYELKHYLVRLFVDRITIEFDEQEEIYTVNVKIKVPDLNRENECILAEHSFYLKKGQTPNLLNYDPTKDKFYQSYLQRNYVSPYSQRVLNGKPVFRNTVSHIESDEKRGDISSPPITTPLPILPL